MLTNRLKDIPIKSRSLKSGFLVLIFLLPFWISAQNVSRIQPRKGIKKRLTEQLHRIEHRVSGDEKKEKLVLTALTISLGAFAVHRLYLGTKPHVPVIYTLTLGGVVMIIPVVDLIHILATKDLDKYRNNPRIIMWGGEEDTAIQP